MQRKEFMRYLTEGENIKELHTFCNALRKMRNVNPSYIVNQHITDPILADRLTRAVARLSETSTPKKKDWYTVLEDETEEFNEALIDIGQAVTLPTFAELPQALQQSLKNHAMIGQVQNDGLGSAEDRYRTDRSYFVAKLIALGALREDNKRYVRPLTLASYLGWLHVVPNYVKDTIAKADALEDAAALPFPDYNAFFEQAIEQDVDTWIKKHVTDPAHLQSIKDYLNS